MQSGCRVSLTRFKAGSGHNLPIVEKCLEDSNPLKQCIEHTLLHTINESFSFAVECNTSEVAISAPRNQSDRPITFISRSLSKSHLHYPAVENKVTVIIGAVRKWHHFLAGAHFTVINRPKIGVVCVWQQQKDKSGEEQNSVLAVRDGVVFVRHWVSSGRKKPILPVCSRERPVP